MHWLAKKHFPHEPVTAETMGAACFFEHDYWEKMQIAVANGIAKAFKG
ncbi:DUF6890 family protein [Zooshikella ganghwensis]